MNLFENLQKMHENNNQIKPYGGDDKNWAMFYVPDNKRSDIIKYAKDKGFDKIYWGSDEALGYGLKGGYNGDTLVVFKDANLLPDGYKEDALRYAAPIEENVDLKNENKLKRFQVESDWKESIINKSNSVQYEYMKKFKNVTVWIKYSVQNAEVDDINIFRDIDGKGARIEETIPVDSNINGFSKAIKEAFKDAEKLLKNYKNEEIKKESFDKKAILHKIDLFAKQITVDKSNIKDMEELLRSKYIDYQIDIDSKPNKATFYLIYKENINNIKNEAKYNSNISTKDELYNEIQKMLRDAGLDENNVSLIDLFNCFRFDSLKELYDYISSEYQDDWEWEEDEEDLEEATSGIGGAYTTQVIDMLPKGIKKVNEDIDEIENDPSTYIDSSGKTRKNWSIYADYEFKIGKEPTISGLLEISKDLDSTKYLSNKDKKELKDYITSRCKTLKTEAVTKFYGKDFDDDVIKDKIEFTKAHPQEFMALKYLDTFEYEGVTYYVASEDKRITYDEKECVVYLVYDENLNKYLAYFEVTLNDVGDAENGPDLQMNISEVPYKIVSI